jgi:TPR repeat protein
MRLFEKLRRRRPEPPPRRLGFSQLREMPPADLRELLAAHPVEAVAAAARHGLVEAQTIYGQMLLDGTGVKRDPAAALLWFEAAAGGRHAEAMNMAGRCHELGWGTEKDLPKAADLYRQAALSGYDWGQFNLANLLLHGLGIQRDRRGALAWYRLAAEQGHAKAMNLVGRFYDEGWDMPRDPQAAFEWYRRSAEAGDFRGQYNYAICLLRHGNPDLAQDWLKRAVNNGSADFLASAAAALSTAPDPGLRDIARDALVRHETAAAAG